MHYYLAVMGDGIMSNGQAPVVSTGICSELGVVVAQVRVTENGMERHGIERIDAREVDAEEPWAAAPLAVILVISKVTSIAFEGSKACGFGSSAWRQLRLKITRVV
jgi:hypothetical protein